MPFNGAALVSEARQNADILDMRNPDGSDVATDRDFDTAQDVLLDLTDQLDSIAHANGFYFGNTEGDGSDFGFWRLDDNSED